MPVATVETLEAYAAETAGCTRCGLAQGRTQVVFGAGNPHADVMFAGCFIAAAEDVDGAAATKHPVPSVVAFRASELNVLDTWHTLGLRGTGV